MGGSGPPKSFASPMAVSTAFKPSPHSSSTLAGSINPWRMRAPAPQPVATVRTFSLRSLRAMTVKFLSCGTLTLLQPAKRQAPLMLPVLMLSTTGFRGSSAFTLDSAATMASTENPATTGVLISGISMGLLLRRLKFWMAISIVSLAFSAAVSSENSTWVAPVILHRSMVVTIVVPMHSATFTTAGIIHW